MTTTSAMKNNQIENANRKVRARIAMEILYKKGKVGEKVTITQDMFRKAVENVQAARNRVAVTAIHVCGVGWASTEPQDDGTIIVTKVCNDRRRDRERSQRSRRSAARNATDLADDTLNGLALA